ncbi:MAG: hypothetical protein KGY41_04765 [Desulfovermiculus sp.]|nr:hypothetical protein [Desulfovermiculus sp.]
MDSSTPGSTSHEHMANSFMSAWISSFLDFWQTWNQALSQMAPDLENEHANRERYTQLSGIPQNWNELMQSANNAMLQSGMWDKLPETLQQMPFISMSLTQVGMSEVTKLAQDWMQGVEKAAQRAEEGRKNPFQSFAQAYADSWQKVLNFPPLGPERFRQQRINQLLDGGTLFVNQFNQFMNQLALPFEKATIDLHKKIQELAEGDGYPETFQEYYNMWLKILEGHFMVLFQSKEFSDLLNEVVNYYVRYQDMQNQVLQDFLKILPVPSNQDFDALAHENYQLKKRVNHLARKVEAIEGQLQQEAK